MSSRIEDRPVPKSTQWARDNKDKLAVRDKERKGTLEGKLLNLTTQSKYRSKTNGLEHNINRAYLRGLYHGQRGLCALSGKEMTIIGERGSDDYWNSISIDRIDSSLGYIEGNVQLVCTGVNYMKKDMTDEMFIDFCKGVVEHKHVC
jgi:hypothetical protein